MISCTLSVDNIQSEAGYIEAGSFTPELPITLGRAVLYNGSQVYNNDYTSPAIPGPLCYTG